ncbi:hypothetical protein THAOC_33794 [Thalassiosira oceanica]|uniref:Uncharacterized protein n=1 Tax=Thalassiosira oceanica TaxID=159749 RepID=K0REI2_THAOC|nr:hypothetical protein THAOC_33794 [Thalassiosira oceanica]|eukprot:EJK47476.1 hypothetical protein THAOC_33794 [Thalassiosira oceanica]
MVGVVLNSRSGDISDLLDGIRTHPTIGFTRERCSGRRRGLSCSAECPLYADGSIGSVRGLRRPQTTLSTIIDLSAPMCERLMCDWAVFDFHMAFSTPKKESSQIGHFGHMTPLDKPLLQCLGLFFLTALLAITSYHTNKTHLAEAPFGPAGNDNGPGLEYRSRRHGIVSSLPHGLRAEPPAVSGGPRKAELSSLQVQGLLSTSTTRAVRAEPTVFRHLLINDARTKQPQADAPFGRADDDDGTADTRLYGPFHGGHEPSFPYFKADYLPDDPDDVCRPRDQRSFDIESLRIDGVRKIRRHGWAQTAGIRGFVPINARRRRRISSISSCCQNNFGR